jgi:hypothetical protein
LPGIAEAVCAAILVLVYAATLAPSLTWAHYGADGGDLVTAVARGSIPHPPGFPAYLLLGEIFIRLPWREPAWRLNLMSAVMAAGAAGLTIACVRRLLLRYAICDMRFAVCAGLCLGLSPLFWSQALIAEVYAPAAFFVALAMFLALRGGPMWALGLAWGVGMGAHPTLIFLAPVVAWGAWGDRVGRLGRLLQVGLLAAVGWAVLYGPLLLARGSVPSPWGDVSTFGGWWALVSGRLYHGYVFALPLADWPQRLLAWAALLARQFTPAGAVLAGLGWAWLWQKRRVLAVASALSFAAFSLYAIGYNTADSLVYLAPALPLAALWLGMGLAQIGAWSSRRVRWGAWALLLLPLAQALVFWGQMDLSGDRTAMEWADGVLRDAPAQAVVITAQDAHTFALWYARDVLGERPDVAVVDRDLWGHEPYRRMMAGELGISVGDDAWSPEEAARRVGRPVVEVTGEQ